MGGKPPLPCPSSINVWRRGRRHGRFPFHEPAAPPRCPYLAAMEAHMCYQIGKIYRGEDYTMKEAVAVARIVGLVAIAAPISNNSPNCPMLALTSFTLTRPSTPTAITRSFGARPRRNVRLKTDTKTPALTLIIQLKSLWRCLNASSNPAATKMKSCWMRFAVAALPSSPPRN